MKISLAAIVKNEEENVAGMLESAAEVCGQLVVVDTGSTDRTPLICTNSDAEVYFYAWDNNFSSARNESLKYCIHPWILALDADERINIESLRRNMHLLENENIGGINVLIRNHMGTDKTVSEHRYTRIFRRNPIIKFEGKIHEQIKPSIEQAGFIIVESDIIIDHYGYSNKSEEKNKRNIELLQIELAENPEDDWLKYHLAETEFSADNLNKAEEIYTAIVNSNRLSSNQKDMSKIRISQIALAESNIEKVDKYLNFQSTDIEIEGLRKFILASSLMSRKLYKEALMLFQSSEVRASGRVNQSLVKEAIDALSNLL